VASCAAGSEQTFVIGGGEIYALFWSLIDQIYLTCVQTVIAQPDAWFPRPQPRIWRPMCAIAGLATETTPAYQFKLFERVHQRREVSW
jgi:dihydrofolate reductase